MDQHASCCSSPFLWSFALCLARTSYLPKRRARSASCWRQTLRTGLSSGRPWPLMAIPRSSGPSWTTTTAPSACPTFSPSSPTGGRVRRRRHRGISNELPRPEPAGKLRACPITCESGQGLPYSLHVRNLESGLVYRGRPLHWSSNGWAIDAWRS